LNTFTLLIKKYFFLMKNSSLIAVLKTMDKKECRDFAKWLASPFFNQRQDVVDLFQYLMAADHLETEKFLEKERIYKKLFPKAAYDDAKFRQIVHFLYKQLEQYLAYQEIQDDKFAFSSAYLKALRRRKVVNVFLSKQRQLEKEGLGGIALDAQGLEHSFTLAAETYTLLLGINKTKDEHLLGSIESFDVKFMADKLKHACLEASHNKVFKTNFQSKFIDEVLAMINSEPELLRFPAIAVYYYGYLIQQKDQDRDADYFLFRHTIREYTHVFSTSELKDIYLIALNYCIERTNKGTFSFIRELFDIYKECLQTGVFIQNGVLSSVTYMNIASAGIRLKEFGWTKEFIDTYAPYLEPGNRENYHQYNLGKLLFEQKKYAEAMQLLFQFDSKHILLNFNAKTMLMKMYYESGEENALDALLDSMRIYLKRKDVIGYHKAVFQNTLKYTKKLVRLNPYDKEKRMALRTEIETVSPLTERPWLLEQLNKM